MPDQYDVAIVGAGPAGSTLAYRLARAGRKTLLLDKARFPRQKPCGGALDGVFFRHLPQGMTVEQVVEDWTSTFILRAPKETRTYQLKTPFAMTQRKRLDQVLVEQAVAAGAEFHDHEPLTNLSLATGNNSTDITTTKAQYRCQVLVGADGAYSTVARLAAMHCPRSVFIASEWDVANPDLAQHYAGKAIFDFSVRPLGYWWLFPKDGQLNTGFGAPIRHAPGINLRVAEYNQRWQVEGEAKKQAHWLPFALPGYQVVKDNVMLVGDAAGCADPATGAGISWGVKSSHLAAEAIDGILRGALAMHSYQQAYQSYILAELQAGQALRNMLCLNLLLRGTIWDSAAQAVIDALSAKTSYLEWQQAHPLQAWLGRSLERWVVPRVT